jgi:hypothetical protein
LRYGRWMQAPVTAVSWRYMPLTIDLQLREVWHTFYRLSAFADIFWSQDRDQPETALHRFTMQRFSNWWLLVIGHNGGIFSITHLWAAWEDYSSGCLHPWLPANSGCPSSMVCPGR